MGSNSARGLRRTPEGHGEQGQSFKGVEGGAKGWVVRSNDGTRDVDVCLPGGFVVLGSSGC